MTKSQVKRIKELKALAAEAKSLGRFDEWLRYLDDIGWVIKAG